MTATNPSQDDEASDVRRGRRRLRVAGLVLALLATALAGLWAARRPIAGRALDRELARAGVPATYDIETLDLGRQRLRNVVIGDPKRPDLVADWLETGTRLTWSGASVTAVRAGRVRLRARLVDGRLSLGAMDRLLPPPTGKAFALPRLFIDMTDARVQLDTPAGLVGAKLSGRGRLDDGFSGRLAIAAPRLAVGGCAADQVTAAVRLAVADGSPRLVGPVRAGAVRCARGDVRRLATALDATLGPAFDRWRGSARLSAGAAVAPGVETAGLDGRVSFNGSSGGTAGEVNLSALRIVTPHGTARRVEVAGRYLIGREMRFNGRAAAQGARTELARLNASATAASPVGPIAAKLSRAIARAQRDFAFDTRVAVDAGDRRDLRVPELLLRSASGARVRFRGDDGMSWTREGLRLDGEALVDGGGLPGVRVTLAQSAPGDPIRGVARIATYRTENASLALTPVSFTAAPGRATRIETVATVSGPIGDGRLDGLSMPLALTWDGRDSGSLNTACAPASFERLAVAGLVLAPARFRLCPIGGALVRVAGGRVEGGARVDAPRLAGRIGGTPLSLAASGGEFVLGTQGFAVRDVEAMLGMPGRVTRIQAGRLDGRAAGGVIAGRFERTGGRIANVPLLLSGAAGVWRMAGDTLALDGAATVADATGRRFEPMLSPDMALRLANGRIAVTGTLVEPGTRTKVADVRIGHDLSRGVGEALLDVSGITFSERLQPDALTKLTFGVIADVRGAVTGEGRIAWSPAGVTSTGVFRTEGMDLAAAFGPVQGLKGAIRFDDLLSLRSAPGQVVTVASINPGIAVTDGVVRFQTLPDTRVAIEGGRWPFAGGALLLRPTLLDFSRSTDKRLTFEVQAMSAAQFLQQFDFENIDASGTFDGVLPMAFDERGGRIEDGRLKVRSGGGTLAYVGTLTQKDLGVWGNIAFQALKSIRYRDLDIVMNGPLSGEMVTSVRFSGVSQGEGAKSNFLIRRLQRLPFVFNIRIKAPFRGLIDSAQGFYDPKRLIERNLPALLEEQNRRQPPGSGRPTPQTTIQPPASEKLP